MPGANGAELRKRPPARDFSKMTTSAISQQLAQLGEEMRSEIALRDDELGHEREELSYDAVDDFKNNVRPSQSASMPCVQVSFLLSFCT